MIRDDYYYYYCHYRYHYHRHRRDLSPCGHAAPVILLPGPGGGGEVGDVSEPWEERNDSEMTLRRQDVGKTVRIAIDGFQFLKRFFFFSFFTFT